MADEVVITETVEAVADQPVEAKKSALEELSENDDADVILAPE